MTEPSPTTELTTVLSFFRTNQILASLLYLPYLLPFLLANWLNKFHAEKPAETGGWLYQHLMASWGSHTLSNSLLTALFLFLTATMLSQMVIDRQLDRSITLFSGLFFLLTASAMPGHLHFSPLMPAMLFLLLSIWQLLKVYKKYASTINLFDAGFWLGIASLFMPLLSLLLIWEWLLLSKLRTPLKTRDLIGLSLGWLSPNFILGSFLYTQNKLGEFLHTQWSALFHFTWHSKQHLFSSEWIFPISTLLLLFFSFQTAFKKKEIGKKKIIRSFYELLVLIALITLLFSPDNGLLQLTALPLGIILALTFSQWPTQTAEGLHLVLYIAALFLLYEPFLKVSGF